jgi:hypothetical protein
MNKSSAFVGAVVVDQLAALLHVPPLAPVHDKFAAVADEAKLNIAAAQSIFRCT